ncbi:DUF4212 domain-containing protein [Acidovorax lacteus]|uniref:Sodium symporter small subunit domain-containing protein n=1 Tax=Acidovorax lacteus TaxID=1924988 RepID=A0ABP8KXE5_9BURK
MAPIPPESEQESAVAVLHDARHLRLKAVLLAVWALVSFGTAYCARDLQNLLLGEWPLAYWMAAQGAVLVFIGIVVVYCVAMNHFEAADARAAAEVAAGDGAPLSPTDRHG